MAARPSPSLAVRALLPLLLLVARVASVSAVNCPDGYTDVASHCFMFVVNQSLSWTDAEAFCQSTGGYLAVLSDCSVFGDVVAHIDAQGMKGFNYWIGATDAAQEGVWLWVTGERVQLGVPFWAYNPDGNLYPSGGTAQNCAVLDITLAHYFNDLPCGTAYAFVCQKSSLE